MQTNYFNQPQLSNSDLTKLKHELSGRDQWNTDDAFHFGTLFDAIVTEPKKVDHFRLSVDGVEKPYTKEQFAKAKAMRDSVMKDQFFVDLLKASELQKEFYFDGEFPFGKMPCRMKMDGWMNAPRWGWDLKSIAVKTQIAFDAGVDIFDWDRQGYFYTNGSVSNRFLIIAVSKIKPHEVFKRFIIKGDITWQNGRLKTNDLAQKYYFLKYNEQNKGN